MTDKKAYHNFDDYIAQFHPYSVEKWTSAVRDMYTHMERGLPQKEAFHAITSKWNTVEVRNFKNWLRFYEEQAHMKYKTANLNPYYESPGMNGYFVPKGMGVPSPVVAPEPDPKMLQDMSDAADEIKISVEKKRREEEERRNLVIQQRKKIIGRLQSARKLLTDEKGKEFSGEHWTKLMDALNELEKQFHVVNVHKASSPIFADLIIRKASALASYGHDNSSEFLLTIAQGLPGGTPPADPNASIPQGGALGNNTPPLAKDDRPGIEKVLDAFNGDMGEDDKDELASIDKEIDDFDNDDASDGEFDIEFADDSDSDDLIVEAQMAPMPPPIPSDAPPTAAPEPAPAPLPPAEKPLDIAPEVTEKPEEEPLEVTDKEPVTGGKDFDALIDAAFSNLKVADIVNRLEDLSRIFKNREIARQLSIVDMMMDRLGLSSFFPSLAEATRSALESNQYCLSRVDEVKSRLSGALDGGGASLHDMGSQHSITNQPKDVSLNKEPPEPSKDPLIQNVQNNLQQQQERDKLKKEMRKKEEEKSLIEGNKPEPQIEGLEQDLINKPAPPAQPAPGLPIK